MIDLRFGIRFRLENREMEFAELEFEIDSVRNRNSIADLLGVCAESRGHLLWRFHIELVGVESPSRLIRQRLTGLNTEQDFMRLGILAMQIMAIVGRGQRYSQGAAKFAQSVIQGCV